MQLFLFSYAPSSFFPFRLYLSRPFSADYLRAHHYLFRPFPQIISAPIIICPVLSSRLYPRPSLLVPSISADYIRAQHYLSHPSQRIISAPIIISPVHFSGLYPRPSLLVPSISADYIRAQHYLFRPFQRIISAPSIICSVPFCGLYPRPALFVPTLRTMPSYLAFSLFIYSTGACIDYLSPYFSRKEKWRGDGLELMKGRNHESNAYRGSS